MLRHRLRGIEVERHDAGELPPICARGSELNQVWTNLIDNAVDAVGEGGHIRITTRAEGDEVAVEVADDGPGIPPEIQGRVFEPFFTTKPVGQGTGLGLAVSFGIIRDHGGVIEVDSAVGRGSTFRVRLPLQPPRRAPGNEEPR